MHVCAHTDKRAHIYTCAHTDILTTLVDKINNVNKVSYIHKRQLEQAQELEVILK